MMAKVGGKNIHPNQKKAGIFTERIQQIIVSKPKLNAPKTAMVKIAFSSIVSIPG